MSLLVKIKIDNVALTSTNIKLFRNVEKFTFSLLGTPPYLELYNLFFFLSFHLYSFTETWKVLCNTDDVCVSFLWWWLLAFSLFFKATLILCKACRHGKCIHIMQLWVFMYKTHFHRRIWMQWFGQANFNFQYESMKYLILGW